MSDIPDSENKKKKSTKKKPESPPEKETEKKDEAKKLTTKTMVHQALTDLKNRKGISLQAIKKYIHENYAVDVVKNNYIIKKVIKNEIESGTVLQTSGTGASGSFKLIVEKKKNEKKVPKKSTTKKTKDTEKEKEAKKGNEKKTEPAKKKIVKKNVKNTEEVKETSPAKKEKGETKKTKAKKLVMENNMKTPAKKRAAMLRRKSIGSIIKPPKMRPKANAKTT